MNKQNSWNSEFRKKRFYERQSQKKEKELLEQFEENNLLKRQKTIAVLLDLEGTCDYIDDEKAAIFVKQIDTIRRKFQADLATISISTHYNNSVRMRAVLEIIGRNLSDNIEIGVSFYYGGTYDYSNDLDTPREVDFNRNKVDTFSKFYLKDFATDNQWFAIIDDGISDDVYKKYQNIHPMLLCRPSQRENSASESNFMKLNTATLGFDGVIEGLATYICSIKNLNPKQILEKQKNIISHLASYELTEKIRRRDYIFLGRYFAEGYADEGDYSDAATWLAFTAFEQDPTKDELIQLKTIFELISQRFELSEDVKNLEKLRELQKKLGSFKFDN